MKNKKTTTIESDIKELHKLITNNPNGINNDRINELQGRVDYFNFGCYKLLKSLFPLHN